MIGKRTEVDKAALLAALHRAASWWANEDDNIDLEVNFERADEVWSWIRRIKEGDFDTTI